MVGRSIEDRLAAEPGDFLINCLRFLAREAADVHFLPVGPVYKDSGRISRLSPCCSMTWAHQPVIRLATKIGVYCGTGMPMVK